MSTPENEVKAAATAEVASLTSRVAALEADAKSFYEKHMPLIVAVLAGATGFMLGRLV